MDYEEAWDGPIRYTVLLAVCAAWLACLLTSAVFWRFRSGWIRRPARFVGAIAGFGTFVGPLAAYQRGVAWPSGSSTSPWAFSAAADLLFVAVWTLIAVAALNAVRRLARGVFPAALLWREGAPEPHAGRILAPFARCFALVMAALFLALAVFSADAPPQSAAGWFVVTMLATCVAGWLAGLRWPLLGGAVSVGAALLLALLRVGQSFWPLSVPGVLYIASWRAERRRRSEVDVS